MNLSGQDWCYSYSLYLKVFHYWENKKQFLMASDRYEDWCMFVVVEGKFRYEINGFEGEARRGDLILCPPDTDFTRQIVEPLTFIYLLFDWLPVEEQLSVNQKKKEWGFRDIPGLFPEYKHAVRDLSRYLSTTRQMHALFHQTSRQSYYAAMKILNHLLNDLMLFVYVDSVQSPAQTGSRTDELMEAVKASMESTAYAPMQLKDVAASYGLTSVQLTRRFYAYCGLTPKAFITRLRMDKAKRLLADTKGNLEEIAECLGYDNAFYFSRVFTRNTGMSPSEYRKMYCL